MSAMSVSSDYCNDIRKKLSLYPLMLKYKRYLSLQLMNWNERWKDNTINAKPSKGFQILMEIPLAKYGSELIAKLKQIAIYKNTKRLQRKKLFYIVHPLLKAILIQKGIYFHIWNQRSKNINMPNPIRLIKGFFTMVKRKAATGTGSGKWTGIGRVRLVKALSHCVSKHSKRIGYKAIEREYRRKALICMVFMIRKALKRNLPIVFIALKRQLESLQLKPFHSKRRALNKKIEISNSDNDRGIDDMRHKEESSNQPRLQCLNRNKENDDNYNNHDTDNKKPIEKLVLYTILKLAVSKWKNKAKSAKYKASSSKKSKETIKKNNLHSNNEGHNFNNDYDVVNQQSIENTLRQETEDQNDQEDLNTAIGANREQFSNYLRSKFQLAEAKKVNREFFAFVKWNLQSKFNQLPLDKLEALYANFQSSYLQAVREIKGMDYAPIDEADQVSLLNYTFNLFRNRLNRSIDSSFGKQLLFK